MSVEILELLAELRGGPVGNEIDVLGRVVETLDARDDDLQDQARHATEDRIGLGQRMSVLEAKFTRVAGNSATRPALFSLLQRIDALEGAIETRDERLEELLSRVLALEGDPR